MKILGDDRFLFLSRNDPYTNIGDMIVIDMVELSRFDQPEGKTMSEPIVTFDKEAVRDELKELVRRTVEGTLNALLEEEADDLMRVSST